MNYQNWDMDFTYKGPMQSRMSVHAGDCGQRVLCNMIGDQPLFYIDDSAEEDEAMEAMFAGDFENFAADELLLEAMRKRLDSYEKTIHALNHVEFVPVEESFDQIFLKEDARFINIEDVVVFGRQSGSFRDTHNAIVAEGVTFMMSSHIQGAFYNRDMMTICLNPSLSLHQAGFALMRSMRLAWHHAQGQLMNPLRFQPEDAVLMNRLIHADLDVATIEMAWELNLAGEKSLWNTMMTCVDFDLAAAFAMEAMTNFKSLKDGLAARATFEKWFISSRCKTLDRTIIQIMLANKVEFAFDDVDTSRTVAMDVVGKVGARASGKNYLMPIVTQIMTDGLFTDIRDRSNANFLWFITFEKKMKESEQELHTDGLSPAAFGKTQEIVNAKTEILSFPSHGSFTGSLDGQKDDKATIFYLDHFRAM